MKKGINSIAVLIGMILVLNLFPASVSAYDRSNASGDVVIEDASACPGEEISLTVSITENPGIASFQFDVIYDSEVLEWTGLVKESIGNGTMDAAVGESILWVDADNYMGTGTLFTLVFRINDTASAGTTQVTIHYDEDNVFDENAVNVFLTIQAGTVTITDPAPAVTYGDANGDGKVDSKDIVLLKRYLANYDYDTGTSTVEVDLGSDANGDGKIDSKDIVLLKRYLANYDYDTGTSTVPLGPAN